MSVQTIEEVARACRDQGMALTVQRRTILEELLARRDHPSADMIFDAVKSRVPGLSRTTVYRVLDTLVRLGAARKVAHDGAVVRFDPNTERHHHLVCERCAGMVDLPRGMVGDIPLPDLKASGFTIKDFSVNYSGICDGCRTPSQGS